VTPLRVTVQQAAARIGLGSEIPWAEIDPGIVELVRALNLAGYPTIFSCSGHRGDEWEKTAYVDVVAIGTKRAHLLAAAAQWITDQVGGRIAIVLEVATLPWWPPNDEALALHVNLFDADGSAPWANDLRLVASLLRHALREAGMAEEDLQQVAAARVLSMLEEAERVQAEVLAEERAGTGGGGPHGAGAAPPPTR
jgi:hypothetical protein